MKTYMSRPLTASDSFQIIASVTAFEPTILDALKVIVTKKSSFKSLPIDVIPLVQKDLKDLQTATTAFEAALIKAAPVNTQLLIGYTLRILIFTLSDRLEKPSYRHQD